MSGQQVPEPGDVLVDVRRPVHVGIQEVALAGEHVALDAGLLVDVAGREVLHRDLGRQEPMVQLRPLLVPHGPQLVARAGDQRQQDEDDRGRQPHPVPQRHRLGRPGRCRGIAVGGPVGRHGAGSARVSRAGPVGDGRGRPGRGSRRRRQFPALVEGGPVAHGRLLPSPLAAVPHRSGDDLAGVARSPSPTTIRVVVRPGPVRLGASSTWPSPSAVAPGWSGARACGRASA